MSNDNDNRCTSCHANVVVREVAVTKSATTTTKAHITVTIAHNMQQ